MNNSSQINVFLIDDHPVVREGYRRLLENEPDIKVVAEADCGEEACEKYTSIKPDVVVLDLNMPGIGGIEAISRLRSKDPNVHILVFSMHDSQIMIMRAIEAGASGYLTKSSVAEQMIDAVRAVANGDSFLSENVVPVIIDKFICKNSDPLKALSKREFEVFCRLAKGQSVSQIAGKLSISPKTAGVHQTNIMKKLGLHNTAELTRLAIRSGVVDP